MGLPPHVLDAVAEQLRAHARLLGGMASLIEQRREITAHQVSTAEGIADELVAAIHGAV